MPVFSEQTRDLLRLIAAQERECPDLDEKFSDVAADCSVRPMDLREWRAEIKKIVLGVALLHPTIRCQSDLAPRVGCRAKTLDRVLSGHHSQSGPGSRTARKLERVLKEAIRELSRDPLWQFKKPTTRSIETSAERDPKSPRAPACRRRNSGSAAGSPEGGKVR